MEEEERGEWEPLVSCGHESHNPRTRTEAPRLSGGERRRGYVSPSPPFRGPLFLLLLLSGFAYQTPPENPYCLFLLLLAGSGLWQ